MTITNQGCLLRENIPFLKTIMCAPGAACRHDKWARNPAPGLFTGCGVERMPRIKRWFPVNHDINRDPEMWDLCDKFGEKALRCWLEILSIADRNEGDIPGTLNSISTAVGWAIRCKSTKTLRILNGIMTLGWVRIDDGLKVTNYAKYHKTREPQKILLGSLPSEPSEPSEPSNNKSTSAAPPTSFQNFWNLYPKKVGKGAAEKAWKKIKPDAVLVNVIFEALVKQSHWRAGRGNQFTPEWKHPATWLNQRCWEDEVQSGSLPIEQRRAEVKAKRENEDKREIPWEEQRRRLSELTAGIGKKI